MPKIASRKPDFPATDATQYRHRHFSPIYDAMKALAEQRYSPWRRKLWEQVPGPRVLEVGVGSGKNMPSYPAGISIIGIDLTSGLLQRAQKRVSEMGLNSRVDLRLGDVQGLNFSNATFDSAVATFVFCSVPDPVLGLRELKRVVKPGGTVFLLDHMRSTNPFLGVLMDLLNPIAVRLMGVNINRRTVDNVRLAGLEIEQVEDLGTGGIFKLITARVPLSQS